MLYCLICFYFILFLLLIYNSTHLLTIVLLLEFLSVVSLGVFTILVGPASYISDSLLILLFSIFVIESVVALFSLIWIVSFAGTDYLPLKNFTNV